MISPPKDGSADLPATKDSTSAKSSGFRSFWRHDKSHSASPGEGNSAAGSDVSPGKSKEKGGRIGRFIKRGSSVNVSGSEKQNEGSGGVATDKRRQQIYLAQKRHRNRRAEYVKSLEDEVAKLRNLDAGVRQEKSTLENQNRMMKELLASHSIDAQLGSMNLAAPPLMSDRDVDMFDFATVDVRFDEELGQERTYLDRSGSEDIAWSSATASTTPDTRLKETVKGNSWAAVDFILALEWPCRGHMVHPGINPNVVPHIECQVGQFTGHSLTATAAVYESALPPPVRLHKQANGTTAQNGAEGEVRETWVLPHSEIDKLVKLSEDLPLDDEQMTPAQAYSAIRKNVASDEDLCSILELLKIPLGTIVECRGYGAVLPADQFWQHFEIALKSLQL